MPKKYSAPSNRYCIFAANKNGEVSEWLKEHAWKVCIGGTLSRVRIPPSPPPPAEALAKAGFYMRASEDYNFSQAYNNNNIFYK